jgi:hypothetical protein
MANGHGWYVKRNLHVTSMFFHAEVRATSEMSAKRNFPYGTPDTSSHRTHVNKFSSDRQALLLQETRRHDSFQTCKIPFFLNSIHSFQKTNNTQLEKIDPPDAACNKTKKALLK